MNTINTNSNIWLYYKQGDIVRCEYTWGKTLFEIHGFHGNAYCPLIIAYMVGKPKNISHMCNLDARLLTLISSTHRPLKRLSKNILLKLVSKGQVEAKRELMMQINSNKFK